MKKTRLEKCQEFSAKLNKCLNKRQRDSSWLANQSGIPRQTVYRWTNAENLPQYPNVIKIINTFTLVPLTIEEQNALLEAAGYTPLEEDEETNRVENTALAVVEQLHTQEIISSSEEEKDTTDKIRIVIARFHCTRKDFDTETHVKIRRKIEQKAQESGLISNDFQISIHPEVWNADDRDKAERIGEEQQANIVIWGEDTGIQVVVNYLNLKHPEFPVRESKIKEDEKITAPGDYTRFIVRDLPNRLTFLALSAIGHSYYTENKDTEAEVVLKTAIDTLSTLPNTTVDGVEDTYFKLGFLCYESSKTEEAIEYFSQAITLNTGFAPSYNNRGLAYQIQNDFKAAMADYNMAIALDYTLADAYINRGNIHYIQNNLEAAVWDYTKATTLNPIDQLPYSLRGLLYYNEKNFKSAIADFTMAIMGSSNPEDAHINHTRRGMAYNEAGNWDAAMVDYDKAIELSSKSDTAYIARGNLHCTKKNWEAAMADYSRAIKLDSKQTGAYTGRGLIYLKEQNFQRAIADFNKAITLDQKNAIAYLFRAHIHHLQENISAAIEDYNKAVELEPGNCLLQGQKYELTDEIPNTLQPPFPLR